MCAGWLAHLTRNILIRRYLTLNSNPMSVLIVHFWIYFIVYPSLLSLSCCICFSLVDDRCIVEIGDGGPESPPKKFRGILLEVYCSKCSLHHSLSTPILENSKSCSFRYAGRTDQCCSSFSNAYNKGAEGSVYLNIFRLSIPYLSDQSIRCTKAILDRAKEVSSR